MTTLARIWQVASVLWPLIRGAWHATHPSAEKANGLANAAMPFPEYDTLAARIAPTVYFHENALTTQWPAASDASLEKTYHRNLSGKAITRPPTPEDIKIELEAASNKAVHDAKCWDSSDGPIGDRNQTRLPGRYANNALTNDIRATISERYGKDTCTPPNGAEPDYKDFNR